MLVALGKRSVPDDLVQLLEECHGRIRRFLVMARQLAGAACPSRAEVAGTAAQIRRYFSEAFPLHVADEEIDIGPRVASRLAPELLARLHADHRAQTATVAWLIGECAALEREPEQHAVVAVRLHALAIQLGTELESHLEFEEKFVFPAVRTLPAREQDAIVAAMRRRRARVLAGER